MIKKEQSDKWINLAGLSSSSAPKPHRKGGKAKIGNYCNRAKRFCFSVEMIDTEFKISINNKYNRNMKRKILMAIGIIVVAIVTVYNTYSSRTGIQLADLTMANIEALAQSKPEIEFDVICVTTCTNCWCYYIAEDYFADGEPWL